MFSIVLNRFFLSELKYTIRLEEGVGEAEMKAWN